MADNFPIENFNDNGFTVLKNQLPKNLLDEFNTEFKNILSSYLERAKQKVKNKNSQTFHSDAILVLEEYDHSYVAEIYDTIFQTPSFLQLISCEEMVGPVKDLLGGDKLPIYGYTNRCRIDPPVDNRRTYGWHQEVFYTIPKSNLLQTWGPLIYPTTIENGTLTLAIGSHKEGIAKQTWTEEEGRAVQIIVDEEVVEKYNPVTLEMNVGDQLIFSPKLFHKSGNNISSDVRFSFVGQYHHINSENFKAPYPNFDFRGEDPESYYINYFKN